MMVLHLWMMIKIIIGTGSCGYPTILGRTKMSAEGKSKHGAAGASNAKNIPFRYGGRPANYSVKMGFPQSERGNGSKLVQAALAGLIVQYLGKGELNMSPALEGKVSAAMDRCTSPWLT